MPTVIIIGKFQEDEAEDRRGILAGFEVGIGAQIGGGGAGLIR